MPRVRSAIVALTAATAALLPGQPTAAPRPVPLEAAADLRLEELSVTTSDGLILPATLRVPANSRPGLPGMVLVHGAGAGSREFYRHEAEAFARAGVVTLSYDRRTVGYSLTERSYSQLADDAVAAAAELRDRPEVDPAQVGIWGLSEGGWVAPLAASRAPETAFLVVVGANGIEPLRQVGWAEAVKAEHAGVRGSLVDATSRTSWRVISGMGLFAEPYHDPGPVLRGLTLPVLGIWGAQDRLTPPVESVAAYRKALDEAGNPHYTLRTFAGAEHSLRVTRDGFDYGDQFVRHGLTTAGFAPGYVDLVGSWVAAAAAGRAPSTSVAGLGEQARPTAGMPPLAWYESVWVHAAAVALLIVGFAGFGLAAAWRRLRGRPGPRASWPARVLAGTGLAAVIGGLGYLGHLVVSSGAGSLDPGPMLAGRPLPWLALQGLAVVAVAAGAAAVVQQRRVAGGGDRARFVLLIAAGVVFVPWTVYWGLLLP